MTNQPQTTNVSNPSEEEGEKRYICIHENKAYQMAENSMFSTWELCPDIEVIVGQMTSRWRGGKIPFAMWEQIVAFLRWTQLTFKAEALITLFYNHEARAWGCWAFAQEPVGMTVKSLPNHPTYKEDRKQFGRGWIQLGSVHHHCTGSAGQSGVDRNDECDRDGLHVTLGFMESSRLDTDIRQVFQGIQSKSALTTWIDMPAWCLNVPTHLRMEIFNKALETCGGGIEFPPVWKERMIPEKKITVEAREIPGRGTTSSGGVSAVGNQSSAFRNTCKNDIRRLCRAASLSYTEAYKLVSCSNPDKLGPIQQYQRTTFIGECHKEHIPPLWPEDILAELIQEEKNLEEEAARTARDEALMQAYAQD